MTQENTNVDSIKAVVKEPGKAPVVMEVDNSLRGYQKLVNGYIESIPFPGYEDDIDIVINDEGKVLGLEPNIFVREYKDIFCGTLVVVGVTPELTWRGLTDEEVTIVLNGLDDMAIIPKNIFHDDAKPDLNSGIQNSK